MPTYARRQIVIEDTVGVYHCIARYVRRAFLCVTDPYTGQDYSHRKEWILDRLRELAGLFSVEVCGYSVMSNHQTTRSMPSRTQSSPRRSLARRACPPDALRSRPRAISTRRTRHPLASSACENTTVATRRVVSSRLAAARADAPVDSSDRPDCGCLKTFSHLEPLGDPHDAAHLWSLKDHPFDFMELASRSFAAVDHRLLFIGHYHRWWASSSEGNLDWAVDRPLEFAANQRYFVVVGPVLGGWCGWLDTVAGVLLPLRI